MSRRRTRGVMVFDAPNPWACAAGGTCAPVPVELIVTGEVVAHICTRCLEACSPIPTASLRPPTPWPPRAVLECR